MKLFICGHARHGKDTAAELIKSFTGMTYESSSWFCCKLFIYEKIKWNRYHSIEQCFKDRSNNRALWHDLIREYNDGDEIRLSRAIFKKHDMYVGIRAREEVKAAREEGLVDAMLWIDASERLNKEDLSSINITNDMADVVIENNTTMEDFTIKIKRFCSMLKE